MTTTLLPISRAEFIANLDDSLDWLGTPAASTYASVLPPWAQTGPYGWPHPYTNELLFHFGTVGVQTVVVPLLNPLEGAVKQMATWLVDLHSWLTSRSGDCQSAEEYADAIEEWAVEANWSGPVWGEG